MPTVFLTGASGFLGGHLLRALGDAGCTVRALSRRTTSDDLIRKAGGEPVRGDLCDVSAWAHALNGCEAIFHAAADTSLWRPRNAAQFATNVDGTRHLLEAAERAKVGAFMHTSSVAAWSHRVHGVLREDVPQRGDESWIGYERTKYLGEQAVRASAVPWIVFNPSHILGPGDRHNWARLIMLIDRRKLPGIPPGTGVFADVREIATAQVRAWQRGHFGERYLLGGTETRFTDLIQRIGTALDRPTPRHATPSWALKAVARLGDAWSRVTRREPDVTPEAATMVCHHLQVDSSTARRELDYVETPLDTLLDDTLAWMRREGMIGPASER